MTWSVPALTGSSPREYGFLRQDIHDRGGAGVRLVEQDNKIAHCGKTAEFSQGPEIPADNGTAIDKDIPDRLLPAGYTAGQVGSGIF